MGKTHYNHDKNIILCKNDIFESVTHITFYGCFNQNVDNIPNHIKYIIFGSNFNQYVDKLPNGLIDIVFGFSFNHPVDNLPDSVLNISFGFCFNRPVNRLPNSLLSIKFGHVFNQSLLNLPKSTKTISMSNTQHINNFNSINMYTKKIIHIGMVYFTNNPFGLIMVITRIKNIKKIPYGCILYKHSTGS